MVRTESRTFFDLYRKLTVVSLALLLWTCGGSSPGGLPSELSHFPQDLGNANLEVTGIYEDGWTTETAAVNLNQPAGKHAVVVRGTIPKIADADFRTDVAVRVDKREISRQTVGVGDFQISAPVEGGAGKRRVELVFSRLQQLPGGDNRAVGARLQFFGFETQKGPSDIVRTPRVQLGSGWGVLETFRNETFRWVENDAQLLVEAGQSGDMNLVMTIEAGPGVEQSCLLKVLDGDGRQVEAAKVQRREQIELSLPVEAGKNEFRLHVDGGGKRTKDDPRVLNFRVFSIGVQ